jgi:outer membrane protein assembly factor BamA
MGRAAHGRTGWLLAAALGVAPAVVVADLGAQVDGVGIDRARVEDIRFLGNAAFPEDSLSRAIATRDPECRTFQLICWVGFDVAQEHFELRERELPRDASRLEIWYQLRGFREVQVDFTVMLRDNGRARVTFSIDEGTPVLATTIEFVGAEEAALPGLLDDLPIRPGNHLSTLGLDATRDTLVRRLNNQGYPRADVFRHFLIPNDDPYGARVTFDIQPGSRARYGDITVVGRNELSEATILRTIPFRTGDPYRRDQLLDAQGRLFGLEIIRTARVVPDTLVAAPDSILPIRVEVQEGDAHRVRTGAGLSTAECANLESIWTSRDFFGGGRRLQVRGRLSNILAPDFRELLCPDSAPGDFSKLTWLAAVDLSQPWIFSTRNSFNAGLFAERQSVPDIYIRTAYGAQVALTRRIGPQTPLTLSYRPELSRLDAAKILFCTGFLVCTPEDISRLEGARRLAPIGLSLTRNMADNLLNPRSGYRLSVDIEHAASWTGSEFRYDRVVGEGAWYSRLLGPAVLAGRLRAGWVGSGGFGDLLGSDGPRDIVHPQRRFYAGGANSVRGFGQSRLGPRILTAEPRDLLSEELDGAFCQPAELIDQSCQASGLGDQNFIVQPTGGTRVLEGNLELRVALGRSFEVVAFQDFGDVWSPTEPVSLGNMWWTPGAGIRFFTPIGPIRLDVAYKVRLEEELSVITSQIRPYDELAGDVEADQLTVDGVRIPFVLTEDLAVLTPTVLFGANDNRFQIHISIGQAF